jgi:hypothetical protein
MDRNEEIKKISELLYNEYISNGWKNVSTESCERQSINYIDVRDLVKKLTLTDVSQQRELLKAYAELIQKDYTNHFFDDAVEESIDKFLSL